MLTLGSFASSPGDPFHITEYSSFTNSNYDLRGRSEVSVRLISTQTTAVLLCMGQSNICNSVDTIYNVTQANNHLFCIYNGAIYGTSEPVLCVTTVPSPSGCWMTRLADKLITAGTYSRVIIVPFGIGGTVVADWASSGVMNPRISATANRLRAANISPTHIIWHQGESDNIAGTSAANYQTRLTSVITTLRSNGLTQKFFPCLVSYINSTISTAVTGAQAAVVNGTDVIQGANSDSLSSDYRYDNLHFNSSGADAIAELMKTIIQANP